MLTLREKPDLMEKMASLIGIKNIRWCDIKSHNDNNIAMKVKDGYEAVNKSGVYSEARIRQAAVLIHTTLKIDPERLSTIVVAWSATNCGSTILWIQADSQTIYLIRKARNNLKGNPGMNFKEYTSQNFLT